MQAKIYSPTKSSMQSGQFNSLKPLNRDRRWYLEFLPKQNSKFIDRKLGHTAATDMMDQINLLFDDLESAIFYAKLHNIDYAVVHSQHITKVKKNYASNFLAH